MEELLPAEAEVLPAEVRGAEREEALGEGPGAGLGAAEEATSRGGRGGYIGGYIGTTEGSSKSLNGHGYSMTVRSCWGDTTCPLGYQRVIAFVADMSRKSGSQYTCVYYLTLAVPKVGHVLVSALRTDQNAFKLGRRC